MLIQQQTIYVWVGVAGLIGCITGSVLFLVYRFAVSVLKIDGGTVDKSNMGRRTMKEFRAARRGKKEQGTGTPSGTRVDKVAALRGRGLMTQPLVEEESEF